MVAAEPAHPLVGYQLPPARLTSVLSTRLASWLKRTGAGATATAARGWPPRAAASRASSGPSSVPGPSSCRSGVDAPVGQVHPVSGGKAGAGMQHRAEVGGPVDVHGDVVADRQARPSPCSASMAVAGVRRSSEVSSQCTTASDATLPPRSPNAAGLTVARAPDPWLAGRRCSCPDMAARPSGELAGPGPAQEHVVQSVELLP